MADYYTLFSFMVGSNNEKDSQYLLTLGSILNDLSEIVGEGSIEDLGIEKVLLQSPVAQEIAHTQYYQRLAKAINYVKPNIEYLYAIPYLKQEEKDVWIHNDEGNSGVGEVVDLLHIWMRSAENPPDYVAFEWSSTCSKPRTDGFGGGAVFITKKEAKWLSPNQWIETQAKELLEEKESKISRTEKLKKEKEREDLNLY